MGLQVVEFNKDDRVAVIELLPFDSMNQIARLSDEISECCHKFMDNDESSVLVITEGGSWVIGYEGTIRMHGNGVSRICLSCPNNRCM